MTTSPDPYNLSRFVEAQEPVYTEVVNELRAGRKRSHWIWFIFPQIAGLGSSPTSQHYAIQSLGEAQAYFEHPILGARLHECTELVLKVEAKPIEEILGPPDDLKFHSSMTLFALASANTQIFQTALLKYFDGRPDHLTLERIKK